MTLDDYVSELKVSIAMDDDDSVVLMKRGVNAGLITAALMYEPSELRTRTSVNTATDGTAIALTTDLTRYIRVEEIYNDTRQQRVWPLEFTEFEIFDLPTSGYVTYYTLFGDSLYYKPHPSIVEALYIYYLQYPARLENDSDVVPLDMYQDFIMSLANMYTWAAKEEGEVVGIWNGISDKLHIPFATISKVRAIIREEAPVGDDIQRAISKGST